MAAPCPKSIGAINDPHKRTLPNMQANAAHAKKRLELKPATAVPKIVISNTSCRDLMHGLNLQGRHGVAGSAPRSSVERARGGAEPRGSASLGGGRGWHGLAPDPTRLATTLCGALYSRSGLCATVQLALLKAPIKERAHCRAVASSTTPSVDTSLSSHDIDVGQGCL